MALSITNMRFEDAIIFKEAAVQYQSWVLVRHTNPKSLRFIGINGFVPKPIECKAKIAKISGWANKRFYDVAGLVAGTNGTMTENVALSCKKLTVDGVAFEKKW